MPRIKLSVLISAVCLMGVVLSVLVGFSQSLRPSVRMTTQPPINQVIPFEAEATTALGGLAVIGSGKYQPPVHFTLQAMDAQRQPLENAKIHLRILTPPKNPWFTTDFPIVEGTKLLDIEATAPKGEMKFQQLLPQRGTYQFLVNVTPIVTNAFAPIEQTLTLNLQENPLKFRYFGILVVILLGVGLGGGWVIGGRQQTRPEEIAPQRVRLLLSGAIILALISLLTVNISAEMAKKGMSMSMPGMANNEPSLAANRRVVKSEGFEAQLLGELSATVGKVANLQVKVIDIQTNQPATNVMLNVITTQLENNWVPFAYEGVPDSAGQLTWQQEFFDGAPHRVEVEVSPQPGTARQFRPFQVSQTIEVEGVAPPLRVRLTSLGYFVSIIVVGLLIGLRIKRLRTRTTVSN